MIGSHLALGVNVSHDRSAVLVRDGEVVVGIAEERLDRNMTLVAVGLWRGYAFARRAIAPLAHEGEPTRTRIEASRPLLFRPRVRMFAGRVALSIGWLGVGFYGLYLAASGAAWLR